MSHTARIWTQDQLTAVIKPDANGNPTLNTELFRSINVLKEITTMKKTTLVHHRTTLITTGFIARSPEAPDEARKLVGGIHHRTPVHHHHRDTGTRIVSAIGLAAYAAMDTGPSQRIVQQVETTGDVRRLCIELEPASASMPCHAT